jgi:hypothetical protein
MKCGDPGCPICNEAPRPKPEEAVRFDERLRLIGPNNQPAYDLYYVVTLADGSSHSGFTNRDGMTQRIASKRPLALESIMLQPPGIAWGRECCGGGMANEKLTLKLDKENLATNDTDVGASVATLKLPEGKKRRLTEGEIAMARAVFADALDYSKVWIHHNGWWLFMGKQDEKTAVTPNGEMYFPKDIYRDDFSSLKDASANALFMHEMAHVWQYQLGYPIKLNAMRVTIKGSVAYTYRITLMSHFCDFNMEQQGNIISDYYMICVLRKSDYAFNPTKDPDLLRFVMKSFLANPRDKNLLPK